MDNDLDTFFGEEAEGINDEVQTQEEETAPEVSTTGEEATTPVEEEQKGEETGVIPVPPTEPTLEDMRKELEAYRRMGMEERRKRQELEQQAIQPKQEEELPDFWENPQAHLGKISQTVEQKLAALEQQQTDRFINMSVAAAKSRHQDFDDNLQVWNELVQRNPALYHQALQQPDPAEYAYQTAKQAKLIKEMGDPQAYRQKVEAELKQKLEAEIRQQINAEFEQKLAAKLPSGMSRTRATGGNVAPTWSGPTPAEELFD